MACFEAWPAKGEGLTNARGHLEAFVVVGGVPSTLCTNCERVMEPDGACKHICKSCGHILSCSEGI